MRSADAGPAKARPTQGETHVCDKETHSAPDVSARRRRDARLAAAGFDGARSHAAAPDGSQPRETLRRHLASPWRGARLLESLAGRQGLRVFLYHEAAGAISCSHGADLRLGYARDDGD